MHPFIYHSQQQRHPPVWRIYQHPNMTISRLPHLNNCPLESRGKNATLSWSTDTCTISQAPVSLNQLGAWVIYVLVMHWLVISACYLRIWCVEENHSAPNIEQVLTPRDQAFGPLCGTYPEEIAHYNGMGSALCVVAYLSFEHCLATCHGFMLCSCHLTTISHIQQCVITSIPHMCQYYYA